MNNELEIIKELIESYDDYSQSNPERIATDDDEKNPAYQRWCAAVDRAREVIKVLSV